MNLLKTERNEGGKQRKSNVRQRERERQDEFKGRKGPV